ncbi:MAG: Long-chain-fatty-acid--CoA ligase [Pseudomonadota bacterium]
MAINPNALHMPHWPEGVPHELPPVQTSVWDALQRRAELTPDELGLHFLGNDWTWSQLRDDALRFAGGLADLGVAKGDRVILFTQNSPQYILAFHAVMRLGAVVVPVNPMNKADELPHYIQDSGANVAIASCDIAPELAKASGSMANGLTHLVTFRWTDVLPSNAEERDAQVPEVWRDWLYATPAQPSAAGLQVHDWNEIMSSATVPAPVELAGDDMALLPYTSGTTGLSKGCIHTHGTLGHNTQASGAWSTLNGQTSMLVVVPMFHITGLVVCMLSCIYWGTRVVLLPRWNRDVAAKAIAAQRVTHWANIPTMVIDLLAMPNIEQVDLSSLEYIGGGGAPMPAAVAARLFEQYGLSYSEGYGLTETAAPSHSNPRGRGKRACLGVPYIGVDARVIDLETLQELPQGETGEIVIHGPQVFKGYWGNPEATAKAFIDIDGKSFFRSGDIGRMDEEGYFFISDRLKRMINASGFKVWPAEVEALLHHHPGIHQVCVISALDEYRGETVKAVVVPKATHRDILSAEEVIEWAKEHMAAYKYPRIVEFVDELPLNASGKLMWRLVQSEQDAKDDALRKAKA